MELAAAAFLFVLSHVVIARGPAKGFMIARWGHRTYILAYSALSLVLMAWMIAAFLDAPRIEVWPSPEWAHGFAVFVTFFAFWALGAGLASPNPISVSMRKSEHTPASPGTVGLVRHPVLWGFGLWGAAHLPANGDSASLLLFGGVIVFALIGAKVLDRRHQKRLGMDNWQKIATSPVRIDRTFLFGTVLGLATWMGLLAAHPHLFGVDPWAVFIGELPW